MICNILSTERSYLSFIIIDNSVHCWKCILNNGNPLHWYIDSPIEIEDSDNSNLYSYCCRTQSPIFYEWDSVLCGDSR